MKLTLLVAWLSLVSAGTGIIVGWATTYHYAQEHMAHLGSEATDCLMRELDRGDNGGSRD